MKYTQNLTVPWPQMLSLGPGIWPLLLTGLVVSPPAPEPVLHSGLKDHRWLDLAPAWLFVVILNHISVWPDPSKSLWTLLLSSPLAFTSLWVKACCPERDCTCWFCAWRYSATPHLLETHTWDTLILWEATFPRRPPHACSIFSLCSSSLCRAHPCLSLYCLPPLLKCEQ